MATELSFGLQSVNKKAARIVFAIAIIPNKKLKTSFTCWDSKGACGNDQGTITEAITQTRATAAMLAPNDLLCSLARFPKEQANSNARAGTAGKT